MIRRLTAPTAALVLAACAAEPSAGPGRADAGPPTDFTETGEIRCSGGAPTLDGYCVFGITRIPGAANLHVLNPTSDVPGIQRVLLFRRGGWASPTGASLSTEARPGETLLVVDGNEFYAVPDRLLGR